MRVYVPEKRLDIIVHDEPRNLRRQLLVPELHRLGSAVGKGELSERGRTIVSFKVASKKAGEMSVIETVSKYPL